jgi:hypothetical protein
VLLSSWTPHWHIASKGIEQGIEFFEARRQVQVLWDANFSLTTEQMRRQKYVAVFAFNAATVEDVLNDGDGKSKGEVSPRMPRRAIPRARGGFPPGRQRERRRKREAESPHPQGRRQRRCPQG